MESKTIENNDVKNFILFEIDKNYCRDLYTAGDDIEPFRPVTYNSESENVTGTYNPTTSNPFVGISLSKAKKGEKVVVLCRGAIINGNLVTELAGGGTVVGDLKAMGIKVVYDFN